MKKLFVCVAVLLSFAACKKHASYTEVKLADGKPGLMMRCPDDMNQAECIVDADDFCHGESRIIASNVGNNKSLYVISCH